MRPGINHHSQREKMQQPVKRQVVLTRAPHGNPMQLGHQWNDPMQKWKAYQRDRSRYNRSRRADGEPR